MNAKNNQIGYAQRQAEILFEELESLDEFNINSNEKMKLEVKFIIKELKKQYSEEE